MSNMVTRCPKCATSFRITSAQLQSAKGAVRCGSCLHIFKAQDHLIGTDAPATANKPIVAPPEKTPAAAQPTRSAATAPTTATKPPVAPPAKAPATQKPSASAVNAKPAQPTRAQATSTPKAVAAPQPTPKSEAPKAPIVKTPAAVPPKPATAAAKQNTAPPKPTAATPQSAPRVGAPKAPQPALQTQPTAKTAADKLVFNQSQIDKEMAELGDDDMLISDNMDSTSKKDSDGSYDFDEFLNLDAQPKRSSSLFERNERMSEPKDSDSTDESWAEDLLDEADQDQRFNAVKEQITLAETQATKETKTEPSATPRFKGPVFSLINDEAVDADAEPNNYKELFSEEELSDELHALDRQNAHALDDAARSSPMRAHDSSRAALLMNIVPEPLEMTSHRTRSWQKKYLWAILSLLMIITLITQVAWLQFNHLSRIQPYRAGYEIVCSIIGCQLPILIDRRLIQVRQLSVRKHPDIADALLVDVILINAAPFEQPFPGLMMAFSDIADKPLAARRFSSREYLAGELAGKVLMPKNQPIYISLELVDPGEAAVNYKIEPF